MGSVVNVVAVLVALAGTLAALGHDGYLAMIVSAGRKRTGGQPAVEYARSRVNVAAVTTVLAVIGLMFTGADSVPSDIVGLLLGGGGGVAATRALQSTRDRFRSGRY